MVQVTRGPVAKVAASSMPAIVPAAAVDDHPHLDVTGDGFTTTEETVRCTVTTTSNSALVT